MGVFLRCWKHQAISLSFELSTQVEARCGNQNDHGEESNAIRFTDIPWQNIKKVVRFFEKSWVDPSVRSKLGACGCVAGSLDRWQQMVSAVAHGSSIGRAVTWSVVAVLGMAVGQGLGPWFSWLFTPHKFTLVELLGCEPRPFLSWLGFMPI